MPTTQPAAFALNCPPDEEFRLSVIAQRSDLAQDASRQGLYAEFFATRLARGAAKCRGQQLETTDAAIHGALDIDATRRRRGVALFEPVVDGLL